MSYTSDHEEDPNDERNWSEEICDLCGCEYDCGPPGYHTKCQVCRKKLRDAAAIKAASAEAERQKTQGAMTEEVRP